MVHHMMNHMVEQVGPRIRDSKVDRYLANLDKRPTAEVSETALGEKPPGFPQRMLGMEISAEMMKEICSRPEVRGMRPTFPMSVMGLTTVLRVLPDDLYEKGDER